MQSRICTSHTEIARVKGLNVLETECGLTFDGINCTRQSGERFLIHQSAPRVCRPRNSAERSNWCGLRATYKPSRGARRVLQFSQKWPEIAGSKGRGFAKPGERFQLLGSKAVVERLRTASRALSEHDLLALVVQAEALATYRSRPK